MEAKAQHMGSVGGSFCASCRTGIRSWHLGCHASSIRPECSMNDLSPLRSGGARRDAARVIRSPRGKELSAKSWLTEAPLRMLMNNLDPEVAEKPEELIVYGG